MALGPPDFRPQALAALGFNHRPAWTPPLGRAYFTGRILPSNPSIHGLDPAIMIFLTSTRPPTSSRLSRNAAPKYGHYGSPIVLIQNLTIITPLYQLRLIGQHLDGMDRRLDGIDWRLDDLDHNIFEVRMSIARATDLHRGDSIILPYDAVPFAVQSDLNAIRNACELADMSPRRVSAYVAAFGLDVGVPEAEHRGGRG